MGRVIDRINVVVGKGAAASLRKHLEEVHCVDVSLLEAEAMLRAALTHVDPRVISDNCTLTCEHSIRFARRD